MALIVVVRHTNLDKIPTKFVTCKEIKGTLVKEQTNKQTNYFPFYHSLRRGFQCPHRLSLFAGSFYHYFPFITFSPFYQFDITHYSIRHTLDVDHHNKRDMVTFVGGNNKKSTSSHIKCMKALSFQANSSFHSNERYWPLAMLFFDAGYCAVQVNKMVLTFEFVDEILELFAFKLVHSREWEN